MKKKLVLSLVTAVLMLLICQAAFAMTSYNIVYDYYMNNAIITGSGEVEDFSNVTLLILMPGKTFEDIKTSDAIRDSYIMYCDQVKAVDGEFSFEVDYKNINGECRGVFVFEDGTKTEFDVNMIDSTVYGQKRDALTRAAGTESFAAVLEDAIPYLCADTTLLNLADGDELAKKFSGYVKNNPLNKSESDKNAKLFNTFALMQALNDGKLDNINDYTEKLYLSRAELLSDYKSVAKSQGAQEFATKIIASDTLSSTDDFEEALKKALVLTAVKYGDGAEKAVNILEKYSFISNPSVSAIRRLLGTGYNSFAEFKAAYEKANDDSFDNKSPSGGGSGSFSNGNYTFDSAVQKIPNEAVTCDFIDIEGVDWAAEAIAALSDKGILNGVGENRFLPNNSVKREEFVKILIEAMNIEQDESVKKSFSDVSESEWYTAYINTAYKNGICKGISETEFGIGRDISRQDMCVMLVNALKMCGVKVEPAGLSFVDAADIAEYAREAVEILYTLGAVNGVSEAHFDPMGTATRAQAAKIVYGVLGDLENYTEIQEVAYE